MSKSPRKKITDSSRMGRKMIYGEKTETFSIAVPKSKKPEIKKFVEGLLKSYRVTPDLK